MIDRKSSESAKDTKFTKVTQPRAPSCSSWITSLVLLGAFFRILPLTDNRFHPDEALYATFARLIASGRDPWLASVVVDKPPLPFYLMAGSMALVGDSELGARLPNLLASFVSVPLVYVLARDLYDRFTGMLAGLLFALSPFPISFAPTAFTDPLHVALLLWSLVAAVRGRWLWSGLAAGLALATKQTTVFFAPLVFVLGALWSMRRANCELRVANCSPSRPLASCPLHPASCILPPASSFLLPLLLSLALITLWDFSRHAPIGFWAQGYSDNVPGRFIRSDEFWPRWNEMTGFLSLFTGSAILNGLAVLGLPILLLTDILRRPRRWASLVDLILSAFLSLYLGAYWLLAFNLWDRYFLAAVPFVCLLIARVMLLIHRTVSLIPNPYLFFLLPASFFLLPSSFFFLLPASFFLLPASFFFLLPPALTASRSGYPLGGDHGAYDGIDQVAGYLRSVPKGAVLYDHWLSWDLRYYLGDAPIYLVWMPDPQTFADDLRVFGRTSPRYFVTPSWESDAEMQRAADEAGFAFEPVLTTRRRDGTESFVLYRIAPDSKESFRAKRGIANHEDSDPRMNANFRERASFALIRGDWRIVSWL